MKHMTVIEDCDIRCIRDQLDKIEFVKKTLVDLSDNKSYKKDEIRNIIFALSCVLDVNKKRIEWVLFDDYDPVKNMGITAREEAAYKRLKAVLGEEMDEEESL